MCHRIANKTPAFPRILPPPWEDNSICFLLVANMLWHSPSAGDVLLKTLTYSHKQATGTRVQETEGEKTKAQAVKVQTGLIGGN